jgi:hypothetical protein
LFSPPPGAETLFPERTLPVPGGWPIDDDDKPVAPLFDPTPDAAGKPHGPTTRLLVKAGIEVVRVPRQPLDQDRPDEGLLDQSGVIPQSLVQLAEAIGQARPPRNALHFPLQHLRRDPDAPMMLERLFHEREVVHAIANLLRRPRLFERSRLSRLSLVIEAENRLVSGKSVDR